MHCAYALLDAAKTVVAPQKPFEIQRCDCHVVSERGLRVFVFADENKH